MNIDEFKDKKTSKEKSTNMLLASFMLFVFPILCVFIGVFLGQYLGKLIGAPVLISRICGGVIAFGLSFAIIKLFDKSAIVDTEKEKIHWKDL